MKKTRRWAGPQGDVGKYTDLIKSFKVGECQVERSLWLYELGCHLRLRVWDVGKESARPAGLRAGLVAWGSLSESLHEMGPQRHH